MTAYVLVQTQTQAQGKGAGLADRLQAIPGVEFAEDVHGPYDVVALARSEPGEDGFQAILDQIRGLPGVIRALAAPLTGQPVEAPTSHIAA